MRLGNILRTANTARPVNPKPIEFLAAGRDQNLRLVKARVAAVFVFVGEEDRERIFVEAREAVDKRYPGKSVPSSIYEDERAYRILFEALRDTDPDAHGNHPRLAETVDELRSALVLPEARRLAAAYDQYLAEEFPPFVDDETWTKLVEEAKKNLLNDLLTAYGYEAVAILLSSLAGRSSR